MLRMNVSCIPFSITKLLCVQFITEIPAKRYRVVSLMSVSTGEMKRTDWIREQIEQGKNMQKRDKLVSAMAFIHWDSLFLSQCLFDIENVKRTAGFNDVAFFRLNLCTSQLSSTNLITRSKCDKTGFVYFICSTTALLKVRVTVTSPYFQRSLSSDCIYALCCLQVRLPTSGSTSKSGH